MSGLKKVSVLFALLSVFALTTPVRAADDDAPSFKKRGDEEKRFMSEVCTSIIKAAHRCKDPALLKYEIQEPKPGRTKIIMQGEYYGALNKKNRYVSEIEIDIDSSDKKAWEVLRIDYRDNNSLFKPNRENIDKLLRKMNQ
jgi:hypothetical protein